MYGEPRRIRQVAERLEARAERLRVRARDLLAQSETVGWVSVAADRMRAGAAERHHELVGVASDYDEAAQRVREHAQQVQALLDLIADIEAKATAIIQGAVDRVGGAIGDIAGGIKDALTPGDERDRRIAATPMPPSGHRDWLEVPELLPGLRP